ncbi:KpsF/GutQ family sugar-phosphate isomerase [Candidatus Kapabacteria bacterium]|nr:KpsF/GutQ family sugar-phosphate isomerase [Candidatus Kapabacteria bacterium]
MDLIKSAKDVFNIQASTLLDIEKTINSTFEKAVMSLNKSDLILTTGVGKSGFISKKIAATLSSYGVKSIFLDPVEALHGDLGIAEKNSSIIMISKSGTTTELLNLLPYIKNRSINVVSITSNQDSFLAEKSDHHLFTEIKKESCPIDLAPTSSTTAALVMGDAISACLVELKGIRQRDFAANHPSGQLGRNNILKVVDVMKSGSAMPCIEVNASLKDAIIEISNKGLGCVCIISSDKLIGILTDGDIRRSLLNNDDINQTKVNNIMTSDPVTVNENELLGTALGLMENRKSQISVMPVTNNTNELKGIIRIHDIYGSENN